MSGTGWNETDLSEDLTDFDHEVRKLELQIEIAKEKHGLRALEEMARQRKLAAMGYNAVLDNEQFRAYTASDFSG